MNIKQLHKNVEKSYMPPVIKNTNENRNHERYPIKLHAHLEISLANKYIGKIMQGVDNIIALVETCNISIKGMLLRIVGSPMDAKRSLTRANASQLFYKPIELVFPGESITVWGKVIRVDVNTLEIAIVINKVSDIQQWKKLSSGSA
jgi:hypothetical protein